MIDTVETNNGNEVDRNELQLWQLIQRDFGVSRNTFKKNHRNRLAKMAKVEGKDEKYVGNLEQNIRIRNRILDNQTIPLHEYPESLKKFTHTETIKEAFTDEKITTYIGNLSDDQIAMLNLLSPAQLISFIEQELKWVDEKKAAIQQNMNINVNNATIDQIANLARLMDMQVRLDTFIAKYQINEFKIDKKTRKFNDATTEAKFQIFLTESKKQEHYKHLIEKYGTEGAEEYIRTSYILKNVKETDSYKKLSDAQKDTLSEELTGIIVDYVIQSQLLNIDLSYFNLESLYAQARAYLTETYGQTENYRSLMGNINADEDMKNFFMQDEHSITEIWPEEGKDKAYYMKLFKRYPELSKTFGSHTEIDAYREDINDDMKIKSDISPEKKQKIQWMLDILPKAAIPYEEKLIKKTNGAVQEFAVSQCIESIQQYMDVDIGAEERLIEQMKILEDKDAITANTGELILKIQGVRNGKKTTLSCDLLSGKVYYHPYLHKSWFNETDPLNIGENNEYNRLPLTTISSISAIISWAQTASKNGEYQKLVRESDKFTDYIQSIKTEIDSGMNTWVSIGYEVSQDMLKKQVIQDDIVQDIIACTGRVMKPQEEITTGTPEIYAFYNYLYRTLGYYSMQSTDTLTLFATDIKKLLEYRNTKKNQSIEEVMKYEEGSETSAAYQNQEMFLIQSLVNTSVIPVNTSVFTDQGPEKHLLSFFKCFEIQSWGFSIIDAKMFDDYLTAAWGTNKKENNVGTRKRNSAFEILVGDMETYLTKDQATSDMLKQFDK